MINTVNGAVTVAVAAVCPIQGISMPDARDKSTWRIDYQADATPQQQAAAQSVVQSFDIAAFNTAQTNEPQRRAAIAADPLRSALLGQLQSATVDQIKQYVDNNVTDLASARTMLKRIILLIALDARNGG